jgi:peptidoglycan/xylan/chitin deacetylase (PgdA/CDA1 family)
MSSIISRRRRWLVVLPSVVLVTLVIALTANPASAAVKPRKPPAPTGLHTTGIDATSVSLAWTGSSEAVSYRVYRGAKSAVAQVTGTSYSDGSVVAGTTYTYTVSAVNPVGESGKSSPLTVTPQAPPTVPATPAGLAAGAVTASSVALSWNASSGATSYRVYRDGAATPLAEPTSTSYADTSAAASTSYVYTVTAVNAVGESAPGTPLPVTTPAVPIRTTVSLTFDDGHAEQYAARSVLAQHNMHGTFFINSGRIDTTPAFMTLSQLRDLASDGNEIAGHTVQHADLTTLSPDEAKREVCNDRGNLLSWGFEPTDFAYPYGHTNAAVEQIVADCGYNSAREVGDIRTPVNNGCSTCPTAETIPPADPYFTRAPDSVDGTWTLADIENLVTQADRDGGGWVQLTFHHIADGGGAYSITPANFSALLDWLQQRAGQGTAVKTVQEVIGGSLQPAVAGPVPPVGQPLQNASLEADASGDGTPDCWSFGTFGSNTATWTRTSDAHTGTWAERVDISSYTSGDRKLVMTQDLGECTPSVTPGNRQALRAWYKGTTPTQFAVYYRDALGKWFYWTSSPLFAANGSWAQASWTTPAVPSGATALSFGLNLAAAGSLTTDDYSINDVGVAPPPVQTALGDNASLETDGNGDNVPDCYQLGSSGTNSATWTRTGDAHTGTWAERVDIGTFTSGDRKLVTRQDTGGCSPVVTPEHSYQLGTWYKEGPARFVVYYRDAAGVWRYWTQSPLLSAQASWTQASWTTPAVPAGATALSFGLNLAQSGTLVTDDYTMTDTTQGQQQAVPLSGSVTG